MRAAICYYSQHHGNTRKVAEAIAREGSVDLIDIATAGDVRLDGYDCVGFASGIYGFEVHPSVTAFARRYLPRGKAVFFRGNWPMGCAKPGNLWPKRWMIWSVLLQRSMRNCDS